MVSHRFIPADDTAVDLTIDPAHTEAIKRWARETLNLGEEAVISVREVACVDPGCPLVETVIVVFGAKSERPRKWRFTRPRVAVTKMMVQQALRG